MPPEVPGSPEGFGFAGAGGVVSGGQGIQATGGEAELFGCLGGGQGTLSEEVQHMADECGRETMDELLVLFKAGQDARRPCAPPRDIAR